MDLGLQQLHHSHGTGVTAVLGPTNTGKTHLAIERMLAHKSGMIGLPLRLLAREVYEKVCTRVGRDAAALVTGEEKIIPLAPRYWIATVEAMPLDLEVEFLAIDEIQLAGDLERGRVFTHRLLHLRGTQETLLLGAATMKRIISTLMPSANILTRPRMSQLRYSGQKKVTRLPRRSASVAFSANDVYAIAELIRQQRGGAAVVLGSLSPRARNAQVALFEEGDVDFLVATDAIGMGLNLDLHHVAFASRRKFDGYHFRELNPAEFAQIAGRAGRYMRDGTFGVTAQTPPFDTEVVEQIETHSFAPVLRAQWRNHDLDLSTPQNLRDSLDVTPTLEGLSKAPPSEDIIALDHLLKQVDILNATTDETRVRLLWDICQIPDYRKIAPANHAELLHTMFMLVVNHGHVPQDWFNEQLKACRRLDGGIDALTNRIAHVRTWAFVANSKDWLDDPVAWRTETRELEDNLSDSLHQKLLERFVDQRSSLLMRRLRDEDDLEIEIGPDRSVTVEGQSVGVISGLRFFPEVESNTVEGRTLRAAAIKALKGEIAGMIETIIESEDKDFVLSSSGVVRWRGEPVARLLAGAEVLAPKLVVTGDETIDAPLVEKLEVRLRAWLERHIKAQLEPLLNLQNAGDLSSKVRGLAFRLVENNGLLNRAPIEAEIRALDQEGRGELRKLGVRFGAHNIYIPALIKPSSSGLLCLLWVLKHGDINADLVRDLQALCLSGRTTQVVDPEIPAELYQACGYQVCGPRIVRIDILERFAEMIRVALYWREGAPGEKPEGALEGLRFETGPNMVSILGCSGEELAGILVSLGFRREKHGEPSPPPQPEAAETAENADEGQEASAKPSVKTSIVHDIWRPAGNKQNGKPRHGKKPKPQRDNRRSGKPPSSSPRASGGAKKPPKIDADSPFAKLAALRDSLKAETPKHKKAHESNSRTSKKKTDPTD